MSQDLCSLFGMIEKRFNRGDEISEFGNNNGKLLKRNTPPEEICRINTLYYFNGSGQNKEYISKNG